MNKYLKYPFKTNSNNNLTLYSNDYDFYDQNIKLFFKTNRGSRIWDKKKGTKIRQFIGRLNREESQKLASNVVDEELKRAFPKLKINSVTVEDNTENPNSFVININYNFKSEINPSTSRKISILIR